MIVTKIEIKDKIVRIHLDNKTNFLISIETYLNGHVLLNEKIEKEEIETLIKQSNSDLNKLELINKLSRKKLSKKECISFLLEKNMSIDECYKIVEEFEKNYLINDLELAEFIIDYCLMNKKGRNLIKDKLIERGIKLEYESFIEQYLDMDKYYKNIQYLISKYLKLASKKSNLVLKKYVSQKMIENGYNFDEFNHLLSELKNDEEEIILREIKRFFTNKDKNTENITKITKKLLSKGFNYDIIKKIIRECDCDETY